jgi:hypothetical protein
MGLAVVERRTIGIVLAIGLAVLVGKGMIESRNRPVSVSSSNYSVAQEKVAPAQLNVSRDATTLP